MSLPRSAQTTFLFLMPLLSAGACVWLVAGGVGITPDSMTYLQYAHNLLALLRGESSVTITAQFPPLFPLVLAGGLSVGVSPFEAMRFLNPLLSALYVLLWGLIGRELKISFGFLLMLQFLAGFAWASIQMFGMLWSEPLFLMLTAAGFYALLRSAHSVGWLFIAALCAGLSFLTRYAGIALIVSAGVWLFFSRERCPRTLHRVGSAACFVLLALLPVAGWFFAGEAFMSSAPRQVSFDTSRFAVLYLFPVQLLVWFFGASMAGEGATAAAATSITALLCTLFAQEGRRVSRHALGAHWIFLLYAALYLMLLIVTGTFLDSETLINDRLSIPVLLPLLCTLFLFFSRVRSYPLIHIVSLVTLTIAVISGLPFLNGEEWEKRLGFGRMAWVQSETLRQALAAPGEAVIFTNAPEAFRLYAGKDAFMLPTHTAPATRQRVANFESSIESLRLRLNRHEVTLVWFKLAAFRWYLPDERQIKEFFPEANVLEFEDGLILTGNSSP